MLSAVKTDNVNSVVFACIVNSGSFLIKALNGCYTRITLPGLSCVLALGGSCVFKQV